MEKGGDLEGKIKTVREEYNKQRNNLKEINAERYTEWDSNVEQLENMAVEMQR